MALQLLKRQLVGTNCGVPAYGLITVSASSNTRRMHYGPARCGLADFAPIFANFALAYSGTGLAFETAPPNPIRVACTVETWNFVSFFTRTGQRNILSTGLPDPAGIAIDPYAYTVFEPQGVDWVGNGGAWYSRTVSWVDNPATGQTPCGAMAGLPARGEFSTRDATFTDLSNGGGTPNATIGYSPAGFVGAVSAPMASALLLTDSIGAGNGDGSGDAAENFGYLKRGINNQIAGWAEIGRASDSLQASAAGHIRRFAPYAGLYTHVVIQQGVNDILTGRSLAQMQADLATLCNAVSARGAVPIVTTLTPMPSPYAGPRTAYNAYVRTLPRYWEIGDTLETSRDSNVWISGATSDGTHPTAYGAAVAAHGCDLSLLS